MQECKEYFTKQNSIYIRIKYLTFVISKRKGDSSRSRSSSSSDSSSRMDKIVLVVVVD